MKELDKQGYQAHKDHIQEIDDLYEHRRETDEKNA